MPEIPLTRVVSVSSADPRHPAENLLRPDDGGRWRGAAAGEKQLSVVLELGDSRPIHSLHIGNDGAAFVEVLGGSSAGGEFQVLLPSAALMSPSESRAGAEPRRVRLFGPESLVRGPSSPGAHLGTPGHTWDRLKVVLSQPYCQSRPYGLSFIRVFAAPAEDEAPPRRRLGPFTLREEGEGSPRRPPGALFYQRPSPTAAPPRDPSPGPSYAAAALRGTGSDHGQPPPKKPKPHLDTPKTSPGTPKTSPGATKTSPGTPKSHLEGSKAHLEGSKAHLEGSKAHLEGSKPHLGGSKAHLGGSKAHLEGSKAHLEGSKPHLEGSKAHLEGSKAHLGGSKPLEGVVLALSGFQNPLRGHLRAVAAALGAQYRPDWGEDCTHLVCTFARTPKASRARQRRGVVVTPEWIWECQRSGRRVSCERYLLRGSASSSSEGEGPDEAPPPPRPSPAKVKKGAEPKEPDTPETPPPTAPATPPESPESDGQSDTDPYGGSTEENSEDEEGEGEPIPQLPDFFQDKTFFFHGEFPAGVERRLLRYVVAFGGTLAPYMDDSVTHVVTAQDWDPAFEEALELRPSLTFVRPHWLLQCGERQRPLPAPPFPRA